MSFRRDDEDVQIHDVVHTDYVSELLRKADEQSYHFILCKTVFIDSLRDDSPLMLFIYLLLYSMHHKRSMVRST